MNQYIIFAVHSAADSVPDANALLCESCGYTLTGLPPDSRCPECGASIADSAPNLRQPSPWDQRPTLVSFLQTSRRILFNPTSFFRHLATRASARSVSFALIYWAIIAILLGAAAARHWWWFGRLGRIWRPQPIASTLALIAITFAVLGLMSHFAAFLTAWEARYRGLRMPRPAVERALHYHAPHYLPVAFIAFLTVFGGPDIVARFGATVYLYALCAEVIAGAAYLFYTYWIAMRNIMYANA